MGTCDLQPIIAAVAGLLVGVTPAVIALLMAISNRDRIHMAQNSANLSGASAQAVRGELRALISRLDSAAANGGQGEQTQQPSTPVH